MIYYLPIEPYQERYTLQLKDWTTRALKRAGVADDQVCVIEPFGSSEDSNAIIQNTGPLDYWRRTRWSLLQVSDLILKLKENQAGLSAKDSIYFQDMFHPGIEALFYIFNQMAPESRPRIYVQNCAQSMDIYDFTYPMIDWMRDYELMCDGFISGVFVASTIHAELMRVAGFKAPIYVTGLPFDREEVVERLQNYGESVLPWSQKKSRVVFSSRFDKEKQPHFFLDIVEYAKLIPEFEDVEFTILQGGIFNSTDASSVVRARKLETKGLLTIHEKLSKEDYYKILNDSKVQINTALQDFVSNTLNESSAFNVKSLLPCFRSFPESVNSNPKYLYVPFNRDHVIEKLRELLSTPFTSDVLLPAHTHHKTLDKVVETLLTGEGINYNGIH